ncbi:MAG: peptide ABC transporter ATP-binding protein [Clostridia bacterium BRH_c25]|nr:MAG: peptide ABC transporter ATP-binding protein [Clostridia bacterium BRH_c25]
MSRLIEIKDLEVGFKTYGGEVQAVRGVSFHLDEGECIGIVGESGCGKSVTAKALLKLIPEPPGKIKNGSIIFNGRDIISFTKKQIRPIRGAEISMIFQDPMTSLNPTMTIERQIGEVIIKHQHADRRQVYGRIIEIMKLVGIPNPEKRVKQYPHEFSGGMRQRVMIAIAMACNPKLLIADEPTTALDVTIQAQILDLMKDLQKKFNTSIMLITHDLGVVANMAQRVLVFYAGKIVESGDCDEIFSSPGHPYTWGLLKSMPRVDSENKEMLASIEGVPPDLFKPPVGCSFAPRCEYAMKICTMAEPPMIQVNDTHGTACWLHHEKTPKDKQRSKAREVNYGK